MYIKQLKDLVKIFEQSKLSLLEIEEEGLKIKMQKGALVEQNVAPQVEKIVKTEEKNQKDVVDFNNLTELKSPIVGVFYRAPSPELAPFVSVGDTVKKGDVLCIIEAMKVMNEITAERDGTIVDICAKDGELVEYKQILFKIK